MANIQEDLRDKVKIKVLNTPMNMQGELVLDFKNTQSLTIKKTDPTYITMSAIINSYAPDIIPPAIGLIRIDSSTTQAYISMNVLNINDWVLLGSSNVLWPAWATADDIVVFNGATGHVIKDWGKKISDLQLKLISWTNIKTINWVSILWSGDITVATGKERRQEWVFPYSYCFTAPLGTLDNQALWTWNRLTIPATWTCVTSTLTNVKWTDRLTLPF